MSIENNKDPLRKILQSNSSGSANSEKKLPDLSKINLQQSIFNEQGVTRYGGPSCGGNNFQDNISNILDHFNEQGVTRYGGPSCSGNNFQDNIDNILDHFNEQGVTRYGGPSCGGNNFQDNISNILDHFNEQGVTRYGGPSCGGNNIKEQLDVPLKKKDLNNESIKKKVD